MTNQEVIEIIKTAIAEVEWEFPMDYAAAFDMAIEALKKQEIIQQKINWLKSFDQYDTMSIKEIIDAFEDCFVGI